MGCRGLNLGPETCCALYIAVVSFCSKHVELSFGKFGDLSFSPGGDGGAGRRHKGALIRPVFVHSGDTTDQALCPWWEVLPEVSE